jgi:DNA (cytosine-5)-methyltransferase 1
LGQGTALRFIDLFCGIGGFRLAFERAGAQCVFSSDWDRFSRQTYAANFGEEPAGDINKVDVKDIPAHDILCGGFPCQPFSLAGVSKKNSLGRKHGFADEKQGNLFFSIADILDRNQPRAFVLENVKRIMPAQEFPVPSGRRKSNRRILANVSDRSRCRVGRIQPCPVGRG